MISIENIIKHLIKIPANHIIWSALAIFNRVHLTYHLQELVKNGSSCWYLSPGDIQDLKHAVPLTITNIRKINVLQYAKPKHEELIIKLLCCEIFLGREKTVQSCHQLKKVLRDACAKTSSSFYEVIMWSSNHTYCNIYNYFMTFWPVNVIFYLKLI